ncbi:MAG TPA: DUF1571 domain-containing protein [Pirellulales bacterium]|nr:DUF1571 domain-containing protein [Pirellulales bacterium]
MNLIARRARWLPLAALLVLSGCSEPSSPSQPTGPVVKPATTTEADAEKPAEKPAKNGLDRALALAQKSLDRLEKIKDYTAVFSKRERVGDALLGEERNEIKLRHEPFSVYLRVIEPSSSAGQEVIYVTGKNDGNLIAHTTGFGSSVIGRVSLDPHGLIATRGNRYTIKDVGLKNLVNKLLELGRRKELFRESTVKIEPVEFSERPCTQVEISSPRPVGDFRLAIARIVLDDEWNVPVHFESHEWKPGATKPILSETYSYYELKFDVGLTDRDFDPDNPAYSFP